jgi:hypothetical protein
MRNYLTNLAYYKFEQLADNVKEANGIKVGAKTPRYDCVAVAGYYKPLDNLKSKGRLFMYLQNTMGIINATIGRRAERYLQTSNSLNFSSVYLLDNKVEGGLFVGFGNPNRNKKAGGKENPFYEYRDDGYLFFVSSDWRTIEIVIYQSDKEQCFCNTIQSEAKKMLEKEYFEQVEKLRNTATIFYDYWANVETP